MSRHDIVTRPSVHTSTLARMCLAPRQINATPSDNTNGKSSRFKCVSSLSFSPTYRRAQHCISASAPQYYTITHSIEVLYTKGSRHWIEQEDFSDTKKEDKRGNNKFCCSNHKKSASRTKIRPIVWLACGYNKILKYNAQQNIPLSPPLKFECVGLPQISQ